MLVAAVVSTKPGLSIHDTKVEAFRRVVVRACLAQGHLPPTSDRQPPGDRSSLERNGGKIGPTIRAHMIRNYLNLNSVNLEAHNLGAVTNRERRRKPSGRCRGSRSQLLTTHPSTCSPHVSH